MGQAIATPHNLRRYPRAQPAPEAPVVVDINGEGFIDVLRARDISESGLGLYVPHNFTRCRIDGPVSLIVSLPPPIKGSFQVNGRIRHKGDRYFGIQFTDLRPADQALIRRYVAYLERGGLPWWRRLLGLVGA